VKLLLTSAGIKNASIRDALVDLLGKPISESSALCIPTAMYGHPWVGPGEKTWQFISGQEPNCPMCELGWKSLGVLELTALPSIDEERWVPLGDAPTCYRQIHPGVYVEYHAPYPASVETSASG